ncbi:MAG TPA: YihY/virulence factor BrkB family protein [Xanthobacteraceae bacterium]
MLLLRRSLYLIVEAFRRFVADDGWAIASYIALSTLMAVFPFLLVLTAIAGFFGSKDLADEGARILLETWPAQVAGPIAIEMHYVLVSARGSVLTIGALLALFFASSGIESLRIGLNRAYSLVDHRRWWVLRLESIGYVIIGAFGLLALSFLVFLAPLIWRTARQLVPALEPLGPTITVIRYAVAGAVLVLALFIVHLWLPAGRRKVRDILPGIVATVLLWLAAGTLFGRYLAEFAFTYSIYYAGLASPMIALVFLYVSASIFIYGAELNHVVKEAAREPEEPIRRAAHLPMD